MATAVCPGSFDPVTNGHLDIFARAARSFSRVIVAVGFNPTKANRHLFTLEERLEQLRQATREFANVEVDSFSGLIIDYCAEVGARSIVKGLRSAKDFDYELPMAHMNYELTQVDTVFLATSPRWSFLSSSLVKEVASLGGDISEFVPPFIADQLYSRTGQGLEGEES